jgi:hypothetical protein
MPVARNTYQPSRNSAEIKAAVRRQHSVMYVVFESQSSMLRRGHSFKHFATILIVGETFTGREPPLWLSAPSGQRWNGGIAPLELSNSMKTRAHSGLMQSG